MALYPRSIDRISRRVLIWSISRLGWTKQKSASPARRGLFVICGGLLSVCWLALGATSHAMTYYVAPNGNDAQTGSSTAPWRTLDRALRAVSPGDVIVLAPGTYPDAAVTRVPGQVGSPITITGPEGHSAVLNGRLTLVHSYYIIRNLHFSGCDLRLEGADANHNIIEFNKFSGAPQGVYMRENDAPPSGGPSWNLLRRNEFTQPTGNGAVVTVGVANVVEENHFHDLAGYDALRVWGVGTVIRKNTFRRVITGSEAGHSNHADIIQTFGTSSGTWAKDIVFERNLIIDSSAQFGNLEGGGDNNGNWIFRNNILIRSRPQINIYIPSVQFYNNTVYDSEWSVGFRFTGSSDRGMADYGRVVNNLFIRVVGYYSASTVVTGFYADFNCVTGRDDRAMAGFAETNGITGDYSPSAIFVDADKGDVRLIDRAVVIDRGTRLAEVLDDFEGQLRNLKAGMDMGAYMHIGTGAPGPPRNLRGGVSEF